MGVIPFRTLPECILDDPRISQVSAVAEVLFRRLWSVVDNCGIFPADHEKIIAACRLQAKLPDTVCFMKAMAELKNVHLIAEYQADGERYLYIVDWQSKWKQGRPGQVPKYPPPEAGKQWAMSFPVKRGLQWGLTRDELDSLSKTYDHLNVPQELKAARAWLKADPARHKTAQHMPRFIRGWLSRAKPRRLTRSGVPDELLKRIERHDE